MKKITFYLLFLFITNSLFSQSILKAYKAIENQDYKKASTILKKNLKKDKLAVNYGYALMYSAPYYHYSRYSTAYRYISAAKKEFSKLNDKQKKNYNKKYSITQIKIDSVEKEILKADFLNTISSSDTNQYNFYIKHYKSSPYNQKVKYFKDSLIFVIKTPYNSIREYKKFIDQNPNSLYLQKVKTLYIKKLNKFYNSAFTRLDLDDLTTINTKYSDYAKTKDSLYIFIKWAKMLDSLPEYSYQAEVNLQYRKFITTASKSPVAYKKLIAIANYLQSQKKYDEAITELEYYRPYFEAKEDKIDSIINYCQIKKDTPQPMSFSPNINTDNSEYFPVLSADGKTLYFCSNDRPEGSNTEDIYVSHLKNGVWTKPQIVKDLSGPMSNEAVLSVSADGNKLLIFKNGQIYETTKTKTAWSEPKEFDETNIGNWNADAYYTADGNAILFASQCPTNIGWTGYYSTNTDIYVLTKDKDGNWNPPINLGPTINTDGIERSPFLHPDMKTLYFSSNKHGAIGNSLDVFKSTRLNENSWTEWSKPVNLGENINTSEDEYAFRISTDGKFAVFGGTNGDNNQDIMIVNLTKSQQPQKVVTVSGKVFDENNNILSANIIWENLENGQQIGELTSDPQTGEYFITLPLGKNYGFYVSKDGFYPLSDNIDLRNDTNITSIHKDFHLTSIKKIIEGEATIALKNIFFEFNKYELKKESYPELNRLADFIKNNPNIKIEISGHTDNVGNAKYNIELSKKRAESVRKYLISQACPSDRLISVGYGKSRPIASNDTEEGRAQNRRVEFKVLK